jgi:hypothetical protein
MAPLSEPVWPAVQGRWRSLVEQELINSLGWMISLRWLAGSGVLAATAVATLRLCRPAAALLVGATFVTTRMLAGPRRLLAPARGDRRVRSLARADGVGLARAVLIAAPAAREP